MSDLTRQTTPDATPQEKRVVKYAAHILENIMKRTRYGANMRENLEQEIQRIIGTEIEIRSRGKDL